MYKKRKCKRTEPKVEIEIVLFNRNQSDFVFSVITSKLLKNIFNCRSEEEIKTSKQVFCHFSPSSIISTTKIYFLMQVCDDHSFMLKSPGKQLRLTSLYTEFCRVTEFHVHCELNWVVNKAHNNDDTERKRIFWRRSIDTQPEVFKNCWPCRNERNRNEEMRPDLTLGVKMIL